MNIIQSEGSVWVEDVKENALCTGTYKCDLKMKEAFPILLIPHRAKSTVASGARSNYLNSVAERMPVYVLKENISGQVWHC